MLHKPFLRLRGVRHEAGPAVCICDVRADYSMRISFTTRDGLVKAYAEQCVNGQLMWWPYINIMARASYGELVDTIFV